MAADGAKTGGPAKPDKDEKPIKNETIAKAAGAVIAAGIAWSLFKSVTGRGKRQVQIQEHARKETITLGEDKDDTLSKDIKHGAQHAGNEVENKAKDMIHGAEHKGRDFKGTLEAAGNKFSHFGNKKHDGKTIQVHKGDTLWGIARKYGVSVEALLASNGIKDADNIAAGDTIVVPK